MSIFADKNLYPGVNAHLNSLLQVDGEWSDFHAGHIPEIARELDKTLPAGYFTRKETSLQISEIGESSAQMSPQVTRPDVTVVRSAALAEPVDAPMAAGAAATIPLTETFAVEDYLMAVVIYQAGVGRQGKPITRIEVLSPANKPPGSHNEQYQQKRQQTLASGLRMVEIDYLHQQRPAVPGVPSYPDQEVGASPHHLLVSDPRPTLEQGIARVLGFGVDDAIPVVAVPLAGDDVVSFDLAVAYAQTYEASRYFVSVVDYATEPLQFDAYRPADRDLIRHRLRQIAATHTNLPRT